MPAEPTPRTHDQILAELYRDNERLRRQVTDAQFERDRFKRLYLDEAAQNDPKLTADDIAGAVPAGPIIEELLRRLERP